MSALVVSDDGLQEIMDAVAAHLNGLGTVYLCLFKNNIEPDRTTRFIDLSEADFSGYARVALTFTTPTALAAHIDSMSNNAAVVFTKMGATGNDIYGYFIITTTGTTRLLWVQRDDLAGTVGAPTPINMQDDGRTYTITPKLDYTSKYPLPTP